MNKRQIAFLGLPVAELLAAGLFVLITARTRSDVEVTFHGLVVHVFADQYGYRDRAVVLADCEDPKVPANCHHPVYLFVPEDINTTELKNATGITAPNPSGGARKLGPLSGLSIRVVGWDPTNKKVVSLMGGPLDRKKTFSDYVPNLEPVSNGTLSLALLKTSLFDSVPDNKDWALFVALDGGDLTATKACKKSKSKKDYKQYKEREFAKSVTLTGSVDEQPALQFLRKSGKWETVTLNSAVKGKTMFVISALPQGGALGMSHFPKFARLGSSPPTFDDIEYVDCQESGLDPSCTNNQWP